MSDATVAPALLSQLEVREMSAEIRNIQALETAGGIQLQDLADPAQRDSDANAGSTLVLPEAFRIQDEKSANWLVRKILESRAYALRVEAWAAKEIVRTQRREKFLLERYGRQLERWVAHQLHTSGAKSKFISLPAGRVGFRRQRSGLNVKDEQALIDWCGAHLPEALQISVKTAGPDAARLQELVSSNRLDCESKQRVSKEQLRQHVQATGECPDGVEPVGAFEKLYIK
jgi:hypothetical protein